MARMNTFNSIQTEEIDDVGYYSRSGSNASHSSRASEDTVIPKAVGSSSNDCRTMDNTTTTTERKELHSHDSDEQHLNDSSYDVSDRIEPADSLWTCERDGAVRIRPSFEANRPLNEPASSIITEFRRTVKLSGSRPALVAKYNGSWKTLTFKQYYDEAWTAAKAFIKLGLEPYYGVGIIGFNSPEWFIADIGAIFAGGQATGIYTTNSPEACQYVASNAKCNVIVVENEQQLRKIRQVWNQLPDLKAVVQYTGEPTNAEDTRVPVYSWKDFMKLAETVSDTVLEERIKQQCVNKCCTLIYTSGTTGNPKGVMLSQDNLIWTAKMAIRQVEKLSYGSDILISYLPLSHVAAQVLDVYVPLIYAATVYFAQPDALKGSLNETMREVRPTIFLGVPRVWEKIQEKMTAISGRQSYFKQTIMSWSRSVGLRGNLSLMNGGRVPYGWTLANAFVFRKVRQALGLDRCQLCLSAAAPIMKETLEFFMSLDMPILELYGMSESTGPMTLSTQKRYRIPSAGTTMIGTSVRILNPDSDGAGEVCTEGRNVFMGYLGDEAKTREALDDDGLLHSGDLGKFDADGFLYITGRIKELLITAGGENVAPVPIEDAVKEALPCVSNCMLIGDRRKFLAILLTLKTEVDKNTLEPLDTLTESSMKWFQKTTGLTLLSVDDVLKACVSSNTASSSAGSCDSVASAIQAGIDRANRTAPSRAQTIQKWTVLPRDFSITGGELGPTLKLKRPVVVKMYENTIDTMYGESNR